jgi:putative peptidoglycan lipid II flippase
LRRSGIHLRPVFGLSGLGKSFTLAGWTLVYVLISQLGYLVTVNVSTTAAVRSAKAGITTGVGFTPFGNAYLIMMLPYSIVTISIVTALLPHLSELAIAKKSLEVKENLTRAIKLVGVVTVPSGLAFLLFGPMITRVLFFGIAQKDAAYIGYVLSALGIGLVAFSINLILIRGFNAFEDTRTQVLSIIFINLISVALSYLFLATIPNEWVTVGLGMAFSLSYILGLFPTVALLRKHIGHLAISGFLGQHARLLLAGLLGMGPFALFANLAGWNSNEHSLITRLVELFLLLVLSATGYFLVARLLHISEVAGALSLAKRQITRAIAFNRNKSS